MQRLFLHIFPTDIITLNVSVNVLFFVSRYKDSQLALMKTKHHN